MFHPFLFDDYFGPTSCKTDWVHIHDKFDYDWFCFMRGCVHHHSGHAISTPDTTDGFLTPVKHGLAEIKVCERDVLAQRMWVFIQQLKLSFFWFLLWKRIHPLWQCWACIGVTKRKQTSDWTRRWRTVKRDQSRIGNSMELMEIMDTWDARCDFPNISNTVCDECSKLCTCILLSWDHGTPKLWQEKVLQAQGLKPGALKRENKTWSRIASWLPARYLPFFGGFRNPRNPPHLWVWWNS